MKTFKTKSDLNKGFPYKLLVEVFFKFLLVYNFLVKVTVIRELHHYTGLELQYHRELDSMNACLYPTM